jgi:signal transduction histidine kinase
VAVVGAAVSVGAGLATGAAETRAAENQLDRRAALVAESVSASARRYTDALQIVASAAGGSYQLDAARFREVAAPLRELRLAGVTALGYVVAVDDEDVAATQAYWRARGADGLVLDPYGGATEHLFSIFSYPLDVPRTPRVGIDATQLAAPTYALTEARRSGRVTMSDAYQLIIDRNLPASRRQLSFSIAAPVYGSTDAAGRRPFRGWVVMGLRGQDFIGGTLADASQNLLDVTLFGRNATGEEVAVARLEPDVAESRGLVRDRAVAAGGRLWHVRVRANGARLPGGETGLAVGVAVAGGLLSLLAAGLVYALATSRSRARAEVLSATRHLAESEARARQQAGLLESIMESISDGVGVVDERGEFILHNPASREMLGLGEDRGGAENWQAHYGIFSPDGVTPFPTEELPLVRALAGESVEQVEMVIRNAGRPEGIAISVSGRPLRSNGVQPGAVAVFHDITLRKADEARLAATVAELQEREKDLQAFAGVAAHDLKAPLAAVSGFAEILDDYLEAGVTDAEKLRRPLSRVRGGVDRMRRLIDDLLTYATARDGQLSVVPVDLQGLVGEVIAERTAHLRAGTTPFPEIYTGRLPTVLADPAMMRQLLDNLVGNALAYTVPGQPARIDIAAHGRAGDGDLVHVVIADRGVGIPPAERERVFDSFHRGAGHGGQSGTGLGLAICQRIVHRHGGTIGVAENPGGGTRMWFTLPASAREVAPAVL